MPSLTELPAELRQYILLLSLPETNRIESAIPAQFIHLFHVNQRLRHDMEAVAAIWTPVHYVSSPSTLTSCTPRTRGWNLSRICLDLFHTSFVGRIRRCQLHPELITLWADAVPFLPEQVKEVWLDVTPAPDEKRESHPTWRQCGPPWLDLFLDDFLVAQSFLGGHIQDVATLIGRIDEQYAGRVKISLSGRLSAKSAFFVDAVGHEIGRELEFVGTWISSEDVMGAAVSSRLSCPLARKEGQCGTHTQAWLGNVDWSRDTALMFAELAQEDGDWALVDDVRSIAEVCKSGDMAVLSPEDAGRRAFQEQIAADLGLKAVEVGEGDHRHVVVRR